MLDSGLTMRSTANASRTEGKNPFGTGHAGKLIAVALAVLTLSGCGNIEPWVKPYERQALADPIMSFDPNPVSSAYTDHVFEAREGARGALGSSGGGCGCN
jgi:hypothetical protein